LADYYETLGVARGASALEIRKAYAKLARERHPDRFSDPVEKAKAHDVFKEVTAAFNTLSNDRSREQYDRELERPRPSTPDEVARDAFQRALQAFEARDNEQAAELLRAAVHHVPDEARYHAALAVALSRHSRTAREAVQSMEKAVQLAPGNAAYHADLAALLLSQGLRLRARKAAEAALKLAPGDPKVQRIAAEALEGDEPPPEAGGLRGLLRRKP
jgi:curved DNA-binding protein CbpA